MKKSILNIFMYHRIQPTQAQNSLSPERFSKHVRYLQRHFHLLSAKALRDWLAGDVRPGPCAVITFDDGWLDNWLYATPVLKAEKAQAILALCTGFTHEGTCRNDLPDRLTDGDALARALCDQDYRSFLNTGELAAMLDSGAWNLQAHGHRHARHFLRLDDCSGRYPEYTDPSLHNALDGREPPSGMPTGRLVSTLASRRRHVADTFLEALHTGQTPDFQNGLETVEDEQAYRTRINNDLMACIKTIHHITGQYPDMLFWPWGEYSDTSIEVAQALGFRWSFSTAKGLVRPDRDGNTIPRIGASPRWNKFRRNAFTYRHPACARFHQLVSPSPSGQIRDVEG